MPSEEVPLEARQSINLSGKSVIFQSISIQNISIQSFISPDDSSSPYKSNPDKSRPDDSSPDNENCFRSCTGVFKSFYEASKTDWLSAIQQSSSPSLNLQEAFFTAVLVLTMQNRGFVIKGRISCSTNICQHTNNILHTIFIHFCRTLVVMLEMIPEQM